MNDILKILMIAVFAIAAINFIVYAAKNERHKVIDIEHDFSVQFPRVYLYICIVFFLLIAALVANMIVWGRASAVEIIVIVVLAAIGLPFLLLSVVWKIKVRSDYIIYVGAFGTKKQIYYKDISRAVLMKKSLALFTTLRIYRLNPNITYIEYFLKRLNMNGVEIDRE